MKKNLLAVFLVSLSVVSGLAYAKSSSKLSTWPQRINAALAPVKCPTFKRALSDAHYKGPLIDTHIHMAPIPDGPAGGGDDPGERPVLGFNVSIGDYVCMMDYENTQKSFVFFPVWEPGIKPMLKVVRTAMKKYPDRFAPFIMPPDDDGSPDGFPTVDAKALKKMLKIYPGLFKGYGEIGLYARGDHGGPKGAPALPPDSERLRDIYPLLRKNKLTAYFHLGEGQKESFERALDANPDIRFIWHGDQLIPYQNGIQDLSLIEDILSKHPNAYYGIDELYGDVWLLRPEVGKEAFIAHFKNSEELLEKDLATWKGFIERHPDQVLWGTDRGGIARWSLDPEVGLTLNTYSRAFIGRLDPSVQEKFAYRNADKLLLSN